MGEYEYFTSRKFGLMLMVGSLILTLTQILATTWCNANSEYFGYFVDETQHWHVCVYEMPGDWLFRYGAIFLNGFGALNLFVEASRTRNIWQETKTINLSRTFFSLGLLSINFMLEILSRAWKPGSTWIFGFVYNNFWYLFPVALTLFVVASWSIVSKVELIFTLNKRNR